MHLKMIWFFFSEENVFRTIMDLFSAGSETTATGMTWLTLFMCVHPDVQKKCQEEIDKVGRIHIKENNYLRMAGPAAA